MPSILAFLAVALPVKVACYSRIGVPISEQNYTGLVAMHTSFLVEHVGNDPNCRYCA
jgi:hypothetical protein